MTVGFALPCFVLENDFQGIASKQPQSQPPTPSHTRKHIRTRASHNDPLLLPLDDLRGFLIVLLLVVVVVVFVVMTLRDFQHSVVATRVSKAGITGKGKSLCSPITKLVGRGITKNSNGDDDASA